MFSEVKNVNVQSLKNGSKLLDFWSGSLPQPLPEGKGFSKAYPNPSLKGRAFKLRHEVIYEGFVYSWCIV